MRSCPGVHSNNRPQTAPAAHCIQKAGYSAISGVVSRSILIFLHSLLPVPPPIPPRHHPNLLYHSLRHLSRNQPPSPVLPHRGRRVDPAVISQPQIILQRNYTHPGLASHNQADKRQVQLLHRRIMVAEIIPGQFLLLRLNRFKPSGNGLIIMCSRISHAIFRVIVGQIIAGAPGIPGIKCELQHLHTRISRLRHQAAHRVRHITQILRNNLLFPQRFLHPAEQIDARPGC